MEEQKPIGDMIKPDSLYTGPFLAILCSGFFNTFNNGAFFLFPLFVAERGGTVADIGYIMGTFSLASVLTRPLMSSAVDRFGRRLSFVYANLIMLLITLSYLLFSGRLENFYLPLLLVRAIHGIGSGLAFTAGFTYVADIIPAKRMNEGLGIFGSSGLLGFAIGPAMAEVIIHQLGFPALFPIVAGAPAVGILLLWFQPESFVPGNNAGEDSYRILFRHAKIYIVAGLILILGFGLAATNSFVALFARSRGIMFVSYYFMAYSGAAIAVRLLGGRLVDRVGETRFAPYAILICGLGLILLLITYNAVFLVLVGIISGAAHGVLYPCLCTMAVRNEPPGLRAKVMA
ncbi:MAG: MFS transporter, partial [Deltaproteobacteria bacterium]|nr:MFS transporter [Deltaproteobacteria bacterium]